jgi:hypothetical protein
MSPCRWTAAACAALIILLGGAPAAPARPARDARVDVRIVLDEAEAVLAILEKRAAGAPVTDADWARLFASEGYVRLKRREEAMGRAFADEEFKAFVLSDALLARAPALAETVRRWARADTAAAGRRALAYLPEGARIHAKVYPSIKPRENSFVFEVTTDPAIFLYVDPAVTAEQFENTLAHELHHIGFGGGCPPAGAPEPAPGTAAALRWIGAFGEGLAMLAAAGGPDVHPHAFSAPEDRARWDRDVANFDEDLRRVEAFLLGVTEGRVSEEEQRRTVASFFGVQGPWYTVGWRMAATIEKAFGRARLVESFCDARLLLSTYNEAARSHNRSARTPLALWSPALVERLGGGALPPRPAS